MMRSKWIESTRTHAGTRGGGGGKTLRPARVGGDTLDCQSRPMMEWQASSQKKRNQDANEDANEDVDEVTNSRQRQTADEAHQMENE